MTDANQKAPMDSKGVPRQWNLLPNKFVKNANQVFILYDLGGETKHWPFSKMWYPEFYNFGYREGQCCTRRV